MKASTTYEKFSASNKWTISQKDFISNIEIFWCNKIAEFKYLEKKTQPPIMAIHNAGCSTKLKVNE